MKQFHRPKNYLIWLLFSIKLSDAFIAETPLWLFRKSCAIRMPVNLKAFTSRKIKTEFIENVSINWLSTQNETRCGTTVSQSKCTNQSVCYIATNSSWLIKCKHTFETINMLQKLSTAGINAASWQLYRLQSKKGTSRGPKIF